jgi:gluconate 2-dehydrogenase gamma chain
MARGLSRRELLAASALVGSSLALTEAGAEARTIAEQVPWSPGAADNPTPISPGPYQFFSAQEASWIDAAVSRLIPQDELGPGAKELGVTVFLDRQLAGAYGRAERWYMSGPWGKGTETQGYQSRMNPAQMYRTAIKAIDAYCLQTFQNKSFSQLGIDDQDKVLGELEEGKIALSEIDAKAFFKQLLLNTQEGFFADPLYGGNKDMAAWKMIGFPGARYDYRDYVKKHGEPFPLPPVSLSGRPAWNSNG